MVGTGTRVARTCVGSDPVSAEREPQLVDTHEGLAALAGSLAEVSYRRDPVFGFEVPESCPGVPSEILEPANTWGNREEYGRRYDALAARFIENFKLLAAGCPREVVEAGPRRLQARGG